MKLAALITLLALAGQAAAAPAPLGDVPAVQPREVDVPTDAANAALASAEAYLREALAALSGTDAAIKDREEHSNLAQKRGQITQDQWDRLIALINRLQGGGGGPGKGISGFSGSGSGDSATGGW